MLLTATRARAVAGLLRQAYRPRFMAHLGLIGVAATLIAINDPSRTHAVAVRLMSSQAGMGGTLDPAAVASVAADIATSNQMMVTSDAARTATKKNEQVALLSAADDALAKRQVVSTAGNATRDIQNYTVQTGDTLSGIASKFNITTSTIKWANGLDDADFVKPGQALTILPISGLLYTVQSGDTADSLAGKFQANAAQILSFNNAEVKGLTLGVQIIIPDGVKQDAPKAVANGKVAGASTSRSTAVPALTRYAFSGDGYAFGYCTYYVASRRNVPSNWGNANTWYYNAQASGFKVGSVPTPGAIAWSGAGYYGHVAYVESVNGGMVTVSEMNYNGNWDRVTSRTVPASTFRYIY
ncbi:MAG TPA: LysM peptidoglycan-binding domain-containing protein [Candidatus Saccharimonadia bacterium]